MEIDLQIKKYRMEQKLSQEELAERVFVTRQTISNWETGKSYPDIHSLLLLSTEFGISLDQLIKGDIDQMKEEISKTEIQKMRFYGNIFTVLFFASLIVPAPLAAWLGWYAFIPFGILFAVSMYFALKVEKIKRENDVQTYKEIVAFSEGKRLDEISQIQEKAKRPYQKVMMALISGLLALLVCAVLGILMVVLMK